MKIATCYFPKSPKIRQEQKKGRKEKKRGNNALLSHWSKWTSRVLRVSKSHLSPRKLFVSCIAPSALSVVSSLARMQYAHRSRFRLFLLFVRFFVVIFQQKRELRCTSTCLELHGKSLEPWDRASKKRTRYVCVPAVLEI